MKPERIVLFFSFFLPASFFIMIPVKEPFTDCRKMIASDKKKIAEPDLYKFRIIAEQNHTVGMSVLAYKEGSIRFVYNYGYSDIEHRIKISGKTIFLVASISKTITGMALMKLIETGRIGSIDDDIGKYLGYRVRNPKYPDMPVTIKHIMTHTSGICDEGMDYDFLQASLAANPPSLKEALTPGGSYYNSGIWLDKAPGEIFLYSNLGAIIAGAIIGKVSGKRFDLFVRDEIQKPLNMQGGFTVQSVSDISNTAVIYKLDENNIPYISCNNSTGESYGPAGPEDYRPGKNPTVFCPYGGFRTKILNLEKIMEVMINDGRYRLNGKNINILGKSIVGKMLKTHWRGRGYGGLYREKGLFIHITESLVPGVRLYGHRGDAFGLLCGMYFDPVKKFGIIFIMNGGEHTPGDSGFCIIEERVFREAYRLLFKKNGNLNS